LLYLVFFNCNSFIKLLPRLEHSPLVTNPMTRPKVKMSHVATILFNCQAQPNVIVISVMSVTNNNISQPIQTSTIIYLVCRMPPVPVLAVWFGCSGLTAALIIS
jgi:hypothetical protein